MQFLSLRVLKAQLILLLTSLALITIGCEDDEHDHDEEHTDADGFVLEDENGTMMYREFKGAEEGSITLNAGETLELTVHFLDHNVEEIEHEDELSITGFDSSIADVEIEEHEEEEEGDHDHEEEEHGMAIHVIGVNPGSTSFQLKLMHEGHADYTSTKLVPIIVN